VISRFPGLTPTRSRAVVHDDLVLTVAVAPDPVTSSMYEQSAKALARIDESLALCGSDKSKILSAIVYITDMKRKDEPRLGRMGRPEESTDAGLHRRRSRAAAYRGDRGDSSEVSGRRLRPSS
jgi:enamine deaminase RidA (YjgF/YER057c/UK114 family)